MELLEPRGSRDKRERERAARNLWELLETRLMAAYFMRRSNDILFVYTLIEVFVCSK